MRRFKGLVAKGEKQKTQRPETDRELAFHGGDCLRHPANVAINENPPAGFFPAAPQRGSRGSLASRGVRLPAYRNPLWTGVRHDQGGKPRQQQQIPRPEAESGSVQENPRSTMRIRLLTNSELRARQLGSKPFSGTNRDNQSDQRRLMVFPSLLCHGRHTEKPNPQTRAGNIFLLDCRPP